MYVIVVTPIGVERGCGFRMQQGPLYLEEGTP